MLFANYEMVRPTHHNSYLRALQDYPNLRSLTLRIVWCDRKWISDVPKESRLGHTDDRLRMLRLHLPDLPSDLELRLIMDSQAQWNGGRPTQREGRLSRLIVGGMIQELGEGGE